MAILTEELAFRGIRHENDTQTPTDNRQLWIDSNERPMGRFTALEGWTMLIEMEIEWVSEQLNHPVTYDSEQPFWTPRPRGARRNNSKTTGPNDRLYYASERFLSGDIQDRVSRDGAIKIDRCFDGGLISHIRSAAELIYGERDKLTAKEIVAAGLHDMHVVKRSIALEDIFVGGRAAAEILSRPFIEIARSLLGHTPALSRLSFVRTIFPGPDDWHLPFHQDETLLGAPLLNLWIALTPCGRTAPGLEVAFSGGKRGLLSTHGPADSKYAAERRQIHRDLVVATYGEHALYHPEFEPGDVMVFHGTTVHRTYYAAGMTEPRMSIEMRLV